MANMSDALIHFATHRFHRLVLSDSIGEYKANTYSAVFAAALDFQNCTLSTGYLLQACILDTCSFHDVTFSINPKNSLNMMNKLSNTIEGATVRSLK